MKTLLALLLLLPSLSWGDYELIYDTDDWNVYKMTDDFTDESFYRVQGYTKNINSIALDHFRISLEYTNSNTPNHLDLVPQFGSNFICKNTHSEVNVRMRIDKNKAFSHKFKKYDDKVFGVVFATTDKPFIKNLLNNLRKGKILIFEIQNKGCDKNYKREKRLSGLDGALKEIDKNL